jgi:DNA-binding IclR family transcriptional regulator
VAEQSGTVKSAERTLRILEHIAQHGHATFMDLVNELQLPRSSTHGLLATLSEMSWVRYDEHRKHFVLGVKAWQISQSASDPESLIRVAKPEMQRVTELTEETVQLAILDGAENVYLAITDSPHPMRLASSVGKRLSAHATGVGKALLSLLPDEEAERRIRSMALPRRTEHTITDPERLLAAVREARERGYATDNEEFVEGCVCIAVPIAASAEVGAECAISVTVPISRRREGWPEQHLEALRTARTVIRGRLL